MKLNGMSLAPPPTIEIVIPRGDSAHIFRAKPVMDYAAFEEIMKRPKPPEKLLPGGIRTSNPDDEGFRKNLQTWVEARTDWMIMESLSATEGLEWETVNPNDPTTWGNYKEELEESGLMTGEVVRLTNGVLEACGLDQEKIEEATQRFLATQREAQSKQDSPPVGKASTPSLELAKDSV